MALPQQIRKIGLKEAIKMWEDQEPARAKEEKRDVRKIGEQTIVKLNGWSPPVEKLDASTASLVKCEQLSLSTNMIERLSNLNALKNLRILSVGRNYLKSLQGVEACADTLEEIWASYNTIEKPGKGVISCKNLRVLYLGNNWIREWGEVTPLNQLPKLEELVLLGNPLEEKFTASVGGSAVPAAAALWQAEVAKKLLQLRKLDGQNILRTDESEQ